jgi:hypothetical protein
VNITEQLQGQLLTVAQHALPWDHGMPSEAYHALNDLAKHCCHLDLDEHVNCIWDDVADCGVVYASEDYQDKFNEIIADQIDLLTGSHTEQTIEYSESVKSLLEADGSYIEFYESVNHAVTLSLLETQGKPGITLHTVSRGYLGSWRDFDPCQTVQRLRRHEGRS